jgi:hypothetical protein
VRTYGVIESGFTLNPVHWPWDASDWRIVDIIRSWEPWFDAILHEDGTLWGAGLVPSNLLGHAGVGWFVQPIRLDRHANWIDLGRRGSPGASHAATGGNVSFMAQ